MNVCLVGSVKFPAPTGLSVNMMPFVMGDPGSIPEFLHGYLPMIESCQLELEQLGKTGYLSVTETRVITRVSQRRAGIHTEKHPGIGWGGGGGWGGPVQDVTTRRDGIYMSSTVDDSCYIWDTRIKTPGEMGNCEHLRKELGTVPGLFTDADGLYWLTDSTPHESLTLAPGTFRQWFRLVTHKVDLWYAQHSTANPLGVSPACTVVEGSKYKQ